MSNTHFPLEWGITNETTPPPSNVTTREVAPFYDPKSLETSLVQSSRQTSDEEKPRRKQLEKLMLEDPCKPTGELPCAGILDALGMSHPNFIEVTDFVSQQVALSRRQRKPRLQLPPILLEGPPGVGKSHFARELAMALASTYSAIDFATLTSGFALSGLHRSWSSGQMGTVAQTLWDSPNMSPVFFLDEIDKPNTDAKSAPLGPLYALLERSTAKRFRDEYLEVDFDLSHAVWIAAANEISNLPQPLLSRFTRFNIRPPTPEQLRNILTANYQRRQQDLQGFPEHLPSTWLNCLSGKSVREAIAAIDLGLGRAALRADQQKQISVELYEDDLPRIKNSGKRVGFF